MFINQGTDGRTSAAVEALQGRVHAEGLELFDKIRMNQCHNQPSRREALLFSNIRLSCFARRLAQFIAVIAACLGPFQDFAVFF
jgi:hypothetical protein